jgi:hypothetical protein
MVVSPGLLSERRDVLLRRWQDLLLDTYPEKGAAFMRQEKDGFKNPVGHILKTQTARLLDGLLQGCSDEELQAPVEEIVRIRAVQEFAPSQAVAFVYLLKKAARESSTDESVADAAELSELDVRLDRLALMAFDAYTRCRERLAEIRINEMKNRSAVLQRQIERSPRPPAEDLSEDNNMLSDNLGGDGT